MKRLAFLLTAVITLGSWGLLMGQEQNHSHEDGKNEGMEFFTGTWDEALAQAKKENKLIFLDIYASWCAPCKMLKNNTFPDPKVGAYYNSKFINVTMDGEKGEGIKLARLMKLTAYPSLYILNSDGELIVHFAGYLKPDEFIEFGKAGLDYLNTMSKKVTETQAD